AARGVLPERRARAVVFFFFQAEDGIRDLIVTGVQTCALPISRRARGAQCPVPLSPGPTLRATRASRRGGDPRAAAASRGRAVRRSEERRVGKECRSGWCGEQGERSARRSERARRRVGAGGGVR